MSPIMKMHELTEYLIEEDRILAVKFITIRKFVDLKELVSSALHRHNKAIKDNKTESRYFNLNSKKLQEFDTEIDNYLFKLDEEYIPEEIEDEIEDYYS